MLTAATVVVGLVLVRAASSFVPSLALEFVRNRLTYIYVFLTTAIVFLLVGYVLGRRIDKFERLSATDALTGLANRRAFEARLQDEWRRVRRYSSSLSLLLIDVDGLKRINDERGHAAGDTVLQATGEAIAATMRETDFGARWGGDEFAIVAPNTSGPSARHLAQRLLGEVSGRTTVYGAEVTISVGVATLEPQTHPFPTTEWLLNEADAALYQAKSHGRNGVSVA